MYDVSGCEFWRPMAMVFDVLDRPAPPSVCVWFENRPQIGSVTVAGRALITEKIETTEI